MAKSKLKEVTTAAMTALPIAGPIHPPKVKYSKQVTITSTITISGPSHPPKVKYSLKQLTITVTITISGPSHPSKVKYFLKLQIPAQLRQVQVQTSMRSSAHPTKVRLMKPAVPATQRLPGPPHPPK